MKHLTPFSVLKMKVKLLPANGQLKVDMSYDEMLDLVKTLLLAIQIDEDWYRATYSDVDGAIKGGVHRSARQHFVEHGYFEGRHPFELELDEEFYLKIYPDIATSIQDGALSSAREHFVKNGYEEGRLPSEL